MKRKTILILGLSILVFGYTSGQSGKGQVDPLKVPVVQWHYQPEYAFDEPVDTMNWANLNSGLHVSFCSTDELYLRSEAPDLKKEKTEWEDTGWRGERLNTQVLVWSTDTLEQIRFKVSDLINDRGVVISKEFIKLNIVRYVLSNFPYAAGNFTCTIFNDTTYLMPDRFETFERFDLPGRSVRPVWITVNIPSGSDPGRYHGNIEVNSPAGNVTLSMNVNVQKQVLPDPHNWKFRLDLWQNPWVVASYHKVEPWSDEHKTLLRKHLKQYAGAGGKYITTYAVYSPWEDCSYTLEGTMIDWTKAKDGSWKFNYSVFDQYVELAMSCGIDKAITLYTPVPWNFRFRYFDEKSGIYLYENWPPTSIQFKSFWNIFLDDLKTHLLEKGWFEKTYLGINENPLEHTLAAIKTIKENSNKWKITYAGNWHPELSPLLDDYSPVINSQPGLQELQDRKSSGSTTSYYVCCGPPKPNTFIFSPPAEGRFLSWYAAARGYDGFLRWAYDAWPFDPERDARHTLWPAGDCYLVYPGGNSSIRFEKLREGISDYEKILIIKESGSKSGNIKVTGLLKELESLLTSFVEGTESDKFYNDSAKLTKALEKGKALLTELSNELEE